VWALGKLKSLGFEDVGGLVLVVFLSVGLRDGDGGNEEGG